MAAVHLPPPIEALLGNAHLAAKIANGHARLRLLQHRRNLLDRKLFPLHRKTLLAQADLAAISPSSRTKKAGAPQVS